MAIYKKPNHQILLFLVGTFYVYGNSDKIEEVIKTLNKDVEISPFFMEKDQLESIRYIHKEWILDVSEGDLSVYIRPESDKPGMDYWLAYSINEELAYDYDDRGKELIYSFDENGILI